MAGERYRLVMSMGPNPGKVFELNMDSMSIGREASNDIVIQDPELSRNHARISRRGGGFVLEDLGSTNGTFINRQRITAPRPLSLGDEIGLGENVVIILQGEGAAPTVAASARPAAATRQPAPPPPAPAAAQPAAPARKAGGNRGLLIGCGILVVVCIVLGIAAVAFDYLNLYCVSPFNLLFGLVTNCG